jgi:hypothetical protein
MDVLSKNKKKVRQVLWRSEVEDPVFFFLFFFLLAHATGCRD